VVRRTCSMPPRAVNIRPAAGPSAEVVGFKGERHKPFVSFRDPFRCPTFTYVQLSR
jgi:hypothetical protein